MAKAGDTSETTEVFRRRLERFKFWGTLLLLLMLFVLAYLWNNIVISIYPGERGVLWERFGGTELERTYREGTFLIFPWNRMYKYDIRIKEIEGEVALLSVDGLMINVWWAARYYPVKMKYIPVDPEAPGTGATGPGDPQYRLTPEVLDQGALPRLHMFVGPDYEKKLVLPDVISGLRKVFGNYTPEQIYAADEAQFLDEIKDIIQGQLEENRIEFHDILIRKLILPDTLQRAIHSKLTQEQMMMAHDFVVDRERKEKDRRKIEAEGIEDFERISNISILKWRGIDATMELAKSPNAKVVIIGNDGDSLPVILNTEPASGLRLDPLRESMPGTGQPSGPEVTQPTESAMPGASAGRNPG